VQKNSGITISNTPRTIRSTSLTAQHLRYSSISLKPISLGLYNLFILK